MDTSVLIINAGHVMILVKLVMVECGTNVPAVQLIDTCTMVNVNSIVQLTIILTLTVTNTNVLTLVKPVTLLVIIVIMD